MLHVQYASSDPLDELPPFPEGFAWGCGMSPIQVEGDTVNEWKDFIARDGSRPDDGPRHWRRYRHDFGCMADIGLNACRIGFDWGRLQPGPGAEFLREPSYRYLEMLAELRSRNIEPFLTLFHFNCPAWLAAQGGWLCPQTPRLFAEFAGRLARLTDGEVRFWITINEPLVYALMAYVLGEFPPGKCGRLDLALRAVRNLARGHALAAAAVRQHQRDARIGVTKHCKRFMAFRPWHPVDRLSRLAAELLFDRWGLRRFLRHQGEAVSDFVGINYYGRLRMKGCGAVSPLTGYSREALDGFGLECDDMWEQDPAWLRHCLADVARRSGLPVYVTENGVATSDEGLRERCLVEHLRHCRLAIADGADVRGYFYWTLMDNFEFGEGLSKRFGLFSVDFSDPNRRREPRPAARLYQRIISAKPGLAHRP